MQLAIADTVFFLLGMSVALTWKKNKKKQKKNNSVA